MTPEQINKAAWETHHWVQDAVGECYEGDPTDDWKARAAGQDAYADEQYEDVGLLSDLYGDHIHDHAKGSWPSMILIAEEVIKIAQHNASTKALNSLIKGWNNHINNHLS